MELVVNGKAFEYADDLSVSQLLVEQRVARPDMVSIELNGKILKKHRFDRTVLNSGDKVEFLYFMGGGLGTQ